MTGQSGMAEPGDGYEGIAIAKAPDAAGSAIGAAPDTAGGGQAGAAPDTAGGAVAGTGNIAVRSPAAWTIAYLTNLAEELHARGLAARVMRSSSGVAFVRVVNPRVARLQETVTCAPYPAGLHDWYYWWSWGECMHRVEDPAGAASKVAHVLDTVTVSAD